MAVSLNSFGIRIGKEVSLAQIELVIASREKDLGGFSVRRILPYASHRMVGPFIFFDHMGPAVLAPGTGMDVRPHPHIGLATVTYLFEGKIQHRDSLGSTQDIEPGAINWMTAGRGIVHSERTPQAVREKGSRMNGIQCWVALPEDQEDIEPNFAHHPASSLPEFRIGNSELKLLLGSLLGKQSPVQVHSDLFYLEVKMQKGSQIEIPVQGREAAVYLVEGSLSFEGQALEPLTMAVAGSGEDLSFQALQDSRLMVLGGSPLGERFIYWNFVSSSKEKIEKASMDWASGPRAQSDRFFPIPGDDQEFIPLPIEPSNPKGTIM